MTQKPHTCGEKYVALGHPAGKPPKTPRVWGKVSMVMTEVTLFAKTQRVWGKGFATGIQTNPKTPRMWGKAKYIVLRTVSLP
ncbi:hypothetical protein [Methylosoma difficile]